MVVNKNININIDSYPISMAISIVPNIVDIDISLTPVKNIKNIKVPSTGALSLKKNILCNIVHKLVISSTISVIYQNDGKSIFFSELLPE